MLVWVARISRTAVCLARVTVSSRRVATVSRATRMRRENRGMVSVCRERVERARPINMANIGPRHPKHNRGPCQPADWFRPLDRTAAEAPPWPHRGPWPDQFSLLCVPMSLLHIRAQQFLILYQETFRSSTYASHRSLPSNLNNFSQSIWCGLKSSRAEISRVILYFESCA